MNIDWRGWTRGQWATRLVVVAGPLLALFARTPSMGAPHAWAVLMVLALAVGWALVPESVVGAVTLLVVGFSWASGDSVDVAVGALVAAAGMLAAHVAALLASYGPSRLPIDPGTVRLWTLRGAALFGAAVVVWALSQLVAELPDSGSVWVFGLLVALSVIVVATAVLQAANPREEE
jgi:hypothetical protein